VAKNSDHKLAPFAQFLLGVCYTDTKQYTRAIEEYTKVIEKYAESEMVDNAGLSIGMAYKDNKQAEQALSYWDKFITEHPKSTMAAQIYYQMAEVYREVQNNCEKAIEYYKKIIDNYPDNQLYSPAAYQAGLCYNKLGNAAQARATFEMVKKEDGDFYKAARGEIGKLLAAQDYQKAIEEYTGIENTATTDEDKATARLGIGDIYQNKKMFKEAAESYQIVVERYQSIAAELRASAYIKLIDADNSLKKYNEVIQTADKMIELFPDNEFTINAVYFKANAYYAQQNYKMAYTVFDQIITANKSEMLTEIASYQKAECLLFQKKPADAVSEYTKFQKNFPNSKYLPLSIYQQGNAYWGIEDYPKARDKYDLLLNKYPDFSDIDMATAFLGFCYDKTDQWKKARTLYQKVLKRNVNPEAVKFAKEQLDKINTTH
jgi:TolA-binding protein